VLGLRNDEVDHVAIRIFEHDWLIVNYVGAGLIAWWRRPDSRFGPLMVAAGFVNFLGGALGWASADVPVTIGLVLALLPPMFFLYVFLAYPTGRLAGRAERAIVVGAFVTAIGLGLARVMLGDGMPGGGRNLIQVVSAPGAVKAVLDVQLMALSGFCLAGIGVLALRRWGPRRAPRRPLGPLVDSFALGLVMIAVLFGSHAVAGAQVRPNADRARGWRRAVFEGDVDAAVGAGCRAGIHRPRELGARPGSMMGGVNGLAPASTAGCHVRPSSSDRAA